MKWLKRRYFELLLPYIHEGAEGYGAIKTLLNRSLKQLNVTSNFQGSWDEGIVTMLAAKAARRNIKIAIHKHPILSWEHFKATSAVWGPRNKVLPIDGILKENHFKPTARYRDITVHDLESLITECNTYLGLANRRNSNRRPAIETVKKAAQIELAHRRVAIGDFNRVAKIFTDYASLVHFRDLKGFTALGKNATSRRIDQFRTMVTAGFDYNAIQPLGWRPIDFSRAHNSDPIEAYLESKGDIKTSCHSVSSRDTVTALMEAMCGYSDYVTRDLKAGLEALYSNVLFKPIMDLAAKDARIGRGTGKRGLRLFFAQGFNCNEPLSIRSGAGAGNYERANNTLGWIGKAGTTSRDIYEALAKESLADRRMYQKSMEGTLIHELTHFAAQKVYKNDALPYFSIQGLLKHDTVPQGENQRRAIAYYMAFVNDYDLAANVQIIRKNAGKTSNPDQCGIRMDNMQRRNDLLYFCIFGHVLSYTLKGQTVPFQHACQTLTTNHGSMFKSGVGQEIISHIPQAIHCFGGVDAVRAIAPNSLTCFTDVFIPDMRREAGTTRGRSKSFSFPTRKGQTRPRRSSFSGLSKK